MDDRTRTKGCQGSRSKQVKPAGQCSLCKRSLCKPPSQASWTRLQGWTGAHAGMITRVWAVAKLPAGKQAAGQQAGTRRGPTDATRRHDSVGRHNAALGRSGRSSAADCREGMEGGGALSLQLRQPCGSDVAAGYRCRRQNPQLLACFTQAFPVFSGLLACLLPSIPWPHRPGTPPQPAGGLQGGS